MTDAELRQRVAEAFEDVIDGLIADARRCLEQWDDDLDLVQLDTTLMVRVGK